MMILLLPGTAPSLLPLRFALPMQAESWLQSQVAGAQSYVLTLILFRKASSADLE